MVLLELNPDWVKPGWAPLIILIVLAVAMALLFVSMRKQFKKINAHGLPHAGAGDAEDPATKL